MVAGVAGGPVTSLQSVWLENEAHFTAAGMSSQNYPSDSFRLKRAAFYQSLKSKVGLAASKAAALKINLNIQTASRVVA